MPTRGGSSRTRRTAADSLITARRRSEWTASTRRVRSDGGQSRVVQTFSSREIHDEIERQSCLHHRGTSGIGLETAKLFRAEAAKLAIVGANAKRLAEAGRELGGEALLLQADLRRIDEIGRAVAATHEKLGRIDVVPANARRRPHAQS